VGDAFNVLSLFSGGGGLDLGIHRAVRGARTVVYVEREAFACSVLAARMEEGALAAAPIFSDVRTFDGRPWRGVVDCVAGGSPCQDLSVAGKRAGLDGERSGLFFQFIRIVEEVRPSFVFWENVGGAIGSLQRVFDSFAALGYTGAAAVVRASDVGAPHQRARVFLLGKLADADRAELRDEPGRRSGANGGGAAESPDAGCGVADASGAGQQGGERSRALGEDAWTSRPTPERSRPEWPPGPGGDWSGIDARFFPAVARVRRVADGVAGGMEPSVDTVWADRLRLLGNGCVPKQVEVAFRFLWEKI
jgi:DNA (cytosine-5)-methyltransferase 1